MSAAKRRSRMDIAKDIVTSEMVGVGTIRELSPNGEELAVALMVVALTRNAKNEHKNNFHSAQSTGTGAKSLHAAQLFAKKMVRLASLWDFASRQHADALRAKKFFVSELATNPNPPNATNKNEATK